MTCDTILRILISIFFLLVPIMCDAQAPLPVWQPGSWWQYSTVVDMHLEQEGSDQYADLITEDENTQYDLIDIGQETLTHGSMLTYNVYRLDFSGTVNAEGIYHLTDPFPLNLPVEIRNATMNGAWWIDTETLGTVYFYRNLQGPLWAEIPFVGWTEVGTAEIDIHEEYEPPKDFVNFPVDVGNNWNMDITLYSYGEYIIEYDIGSGTETVEDSFDDFASFNFDMAVTGMELVGGLQTYRIEGDESSSDSAILNNYAPDCRNTAYELLENFGADGSIEINSVTRTLDDYFLPPEATPSPTQTPTMIPVTPTHTPVNTPTMPPCLNNGDVDNSGALTPQDALMAFQIYLGIITDPTYQQYCSADCNGNGNVTPEDALCIFQNYVSGSCQCDDPVD